MKLFAIGDLHLNGKADKPMDVFGSNWDRHREKIFDAWQSLVSPSDCVLVPGDICWAMYLEDAVDDLNSIAELNGTKILIRVFGMRFTRLDASFGCQLRKSRRKDFQPRIDTA